MSDNLPPAAKTVLTGTQTEELNNLQIELDTERKTHGKTREEKKAREVRINELELEIKELRRLQSAPPVKPTPKNEGWTFFDTSTEA